MKNAKAYQKSLDYGEKICEELEKLGVAYSDATTSNFIAVCKLYFNQVAECGEKSSRCHQSYQNGARDGVWQILYNILGSFELLEGFERNFYISLVGNDDGYELPLSLGVKGE